jgi:hypothetical protein
VERSPADEPTDEQPSGGAKRSRIAGPVAGRTYSLYGRAWTSDGYFEQVEALLDECLGRWPDAGALLGVLGIACIPELLAGMRRCARAGVPVLGLPLDANRCGRWLGEFRQNTVNLDRLELLASAARR